MATNPFPTLQHTLQSQLYLDHSPSYHTQLYCLSAVLGVSLVLALASLSLRIHRQQCWLYRLHPTAFGSWITPNPIVLWLTGSTVFLACESVTSHRKPTSWILAIRKNSTKWGADNKLPRLVAQVYIYYAIQYGTEGSDVGNAMVWRLIIWCATRRCHHRPRAH